MLSKTRFPVMAVLALPPPTLAGAGCTLAQESWCILANFLDFPPVDMAILESL